MFFPSLPVTASAICPRCFAFFSQLRATAFEISGPAGPAQRGATAGKPEAPGHPEVAAGVARR